MPPDARRTAPTAVRHPNVVPSVGNWMITLIIVVVLAVMTIHAGDMHTALLLGGIWFINWSGIPVIVLMPVSFVISQLAFKQTGMAHSDPIFVILCNQRAAKLGLKPDWKLDFDRLEEIQRVAQPA